MVYLQTRIRSGEWDAKILWDFEIQTDHLIPVKRPDLVIINKRKKLENLLDSELCRHGRSQSENKRKRKKRQYLDLARELKKLWNMKVTVILTIISALWTISKGLVKGIEELEIGGQAETIQTTALLRSAKILKRVLETQGDLQSLRLQ